MTVRLYRHDDTSAPVLTGQAGSLTTLLDAVLVNGYGSKTGAGWSIAQTTTNKRGYKQGAGGNHPVGIFFYIDDTGPGSAGACEARCCGFETMSAVTPVGTGQFPNATQSGIGFGALVIRKSNTNDSVPRRWYIVANAWTFYLFIEAGDNGPPYLSGYATFFGDFKAFKSGDAYAQMIITRAVENNTLAWYEPSGCWKGASNYGVNNIMFGHFFTRHWNQITPSVGGGKMADENGNDQDSWLSDSDVRTAEFGGNGPGANWNNTQFAPYPDPITGAMWMVPIFLNQNGMRGFLKGVWYPKHHMPLNPGDTFTVSDGELAGKSFVACHGTVSIGGPTQRPVQFFIEYSDTWPS